jgi:hypothetical protein
VLDQEPTNKKPNVTSSAIFGFYMVTNGFPKYHAIQKGFEDNVIFFLSKVFCH